MFFSKLIHSGRFIVLSFIIFLSCSRAYYVRNDFDFPEPVDTKNREIEIQQKKQYQIDGVTAENLFDGARLNGFEKVADSVFQAVIKAENYPVNESPWYSFRISSSKARTIYLKLKYINANHRYIPKISRDGVKWTAIDTSLIKKDTADNSAMFKLDIFPSSIYVSAQEIINSADTENWKNSLKISKLTSEFTSVGSTPLGKDISFFRIGKGQSKGKRVVILTGRLHPPEISGFKALQAFVEKALQANIYSTDFFSKYDIWVFPCLNPDGVDLGNWRHNFNGVDLNRDWAYYRQPETDIITEYIVDRAKRNKNRIMLSIDFHSTTEDIYYVFDDKFNSRLKNFAKEWTDEIDKGVFPFKTLFSPEPMGKPYSKTWFYKQFRAESITYEVGDETDRAIIRKKAEIGAVSMMKLLSR
jgi:cytosolic carboxypeptidase protein 6